MAPQSIPAALSMGLILGLGLSLVTLKASRLSQECILLGFNLGTPTHKLSVCFQLSHTRWVLHDALDIESFCFLIAWLPVVFGGWSGFFSGDVLGGMTVGQRNLACLLE